MGRGSLERRIQTVSETELNEPKMVQNIIYENFSWSGSNLNKKIGLNTN